MPTIKRDEATPPVPLTVDEVKMLMQFGDMYREAMATAAAAQQMEVQYQEVLRSKYGLGPEWTCISCLVGFERLEVVEEDNHG